MLVIATMWSIFQFAAVGLREAGLTRDNIDELERRCIIHANNDDKRLVLLTGRLTQSRFKGQAVASCGGEDQPKCKSAEWFPASFEGIFEQTNHYSPKQKVRIKAVDMSLDELKSLDLKVGFPYAFCAEPAAMHKGLPQFNVSRFETIYRLVPVTPSK